MKWLFWIATINNFCFRLSGIKTWMPFLFFHCCIFRNKRTRKRYQWIGKSANRRRSWQLHYIWYSVAIARLWHNISRKYEKLLFTVAGRTWPYFRNAKAKCKVSMSLTNRSVCLLYIVLVLFTISIPDFIKGEVGS